MKKIFTFGLSAMFMLLGGVNVTAQTPVTILEDLTSSKIQNADFSADKPVTTIIYTYDYNMLDNGLGAGGTNLFGMQAVTGWTASSPSDNIKVMESSNSENRTDGANAKAAGVYAYTDDSVDDNLPGLGGSYYAPYLEEGVTGQSLGLVAVWGAAAAYTQDVTLPAGDYMMLINYQNVSGSASVNRSRNGFIAEDGTEFISSKVAYTVMLWETDTIFIRLKAETKGQISLGYQSGNFGSGDAPHLFIDHVKLYSISTSTLDKIEIEKAKAELWELIEAGNQIGADTKEAKAVYEDANATLEQVKAAIERQKVINESSTTDLSAFFISNPHFTLDTPLPNDNGITTYDYDMADPNGANQRVVDYYGMQPITDWEANHPGENSYAAGIFSVGSNSFLGGAAYLPPLQMSDGATEGNLLGLVTCWSATAQYTQKVTLPAGTYTLSMSYYNSGGSQAVAKNLIGFVTDDGTEYLGTTLTFPVGKWTTDRVVFTLDEPTSGYFTMGYTATNTGSGNMPHFFIDGIAIYYVGDTEFDPSLMGLQAAVTVGQSYLDKKFYTELKEEFEEAVNAGDALVKSQSNDADANTAAMEAINALLPQVTANINAYQKLDVFYNEGGALANALVKYEKSAPALYERLLLLNDDVMMVLDEYNWATAEIEAAIASLDTIVIEGVKEAWETTATSGEPLDEDLDISILFDQLAYTYSTTAQSGANVPDKEWVYGDATNFKTQYGTAEVWNQSPFAVSRTIKDMPAGTYTITTKAFYRIADNVTNYDSYQNYDGKAYVFAGASKTELANVAEIASDTAPEGLGWAEVAASSTVYHPNSQQAAYNTFESDEYTETLQKSVATVIAGEKGDLTFGITADQLEDNAWVVWYTFSISYNTVNEDVLNGELEQLIETALNYLDENGGEINTYAESQLQKAITDAENAVGADVEEMSAAVVALQTAMNIAKENLTNMLALEDAKTALGEAADTYGDTASAEAMAAYDAIVDEAEDVDDLTNEELKNLIERILKVADKLRVPASDGASDDNPIDMTVVIKNADFEQNGGNGSADVPGWNADTDGIAKKVKDPAINGKSTEFWDSTPSTSEFNLYQTLANLPAGTYELGAYAVCAQVDTEDEGYVALYAVTSDGTTSSTPVEILPNMEGKTYPADAEVLASAKPYSIIFTLKEGEEVTIGFQSIGTLSTRWFVCDDFTLTYYGTASSKEATPDDGLVVIDGINSESSAINAIYTVTGAKVSSLQKGINLVKMADGTVQKVLVK